MSSMVNVDSSERKVNELVALQAIYGDGLSDVWLRTHKRPCLQLSQHQLDLLTSSIQLTPCYQEAALLTATGQQQAS